MWLGIAIMMVMCIGPILWVMQVMKRDKGLNSALGYRPPIPEAIMPDYVFGMFDST